MIWILLAPSAVSSIRLHSCQLKIFYTNDFLDPFPVCSHTYADFVDGVFEAEQHNKTSFIESSEGSGLKWFPHFNNIRNGHVKVIIIYPGNKLNVNMNNHIFPLARKMLRYFFLTYREPSCHKNMTVFLLLWTHNEFIMSACNRQLCKDGLSLLA